MRVAGGVDTSAQHAIDAYRLAQVDAHDDARLRHNIKRGKTEGDARNAAPCLARDPQQDERKSHVVHRTVHACRAGAH